MREIVRQLFEPPIQVAETDPRTADPALLHPSEAAQVEGAIDKRRREYAAGRVLARRLLSELGLESPPPILNGADRAPIWPDGVRGTIAHTERWAAVAICLEGEIASLGCDLELAGSLEESTWSLVLGQRERGEIERLPAARRGPAVKLLFSAKEAAYKALYPLTRRALGFADVEIDLLDGRERFTATVWRETPPFRRGQTLSGRCRLADGLIATSVTVRRDEIDPS